MPEVFNGPSTEGNLATLDFSSGIGSDFATTETSHRWFALSMVSSWPSAASGAEEFGEMPEHLIAGRRVEIPPGGGDRRGLTLGGRSSTTGVGVSKAHFGWGKKGRRR